MAYIEDPGWGRERGVGNTGEYSSKSEPRSIHKFAPHYTLFHIYFEESFFALTSFVLLAPLHNHSKIVFPVGKPLTRNFILRPIIIVLFDIEVLI